MAEWVDNTLRVIGPADGVAEFKRLASPASAGEAFSFEALVAEWTRSASEADPRTRGIREELGARHVARTSRDSELVEEGEGSVTYTFESEWNPPHAHVVAASALFPALTFLHDYEQMNLGWRGRQVVREGLIIAKARGAYGPDGPEFYDQTDPLPDVFAPYVPAGVITVTAGAATREIALTRADLQNLATLNQEEPTSYLIVRWAADWVRYYLGGEASEGRAAGIPEGFAAARGRIVVGGITREIEVGALQAANIAESGDGGPGDEGLAKWLAYQIEYELKRAPETLDENEPPLEPYAVGSRKTFTVELDGRCLLALKCRHAAGHAGVILFASREDYVVATAGLPGAELADDEVLLRDEGGMLATLVEAGVVEETGRAAPGGRADLRVCRLLAYSNAEGKPGVEGLTTGGVE